MPAKTKVTLTAESRAELLYLRDHASKPYLRERAAAILKVADGHPVYQVAATGLLKPRAPTTVGNWIKRYQAEGVQGLYIRPGRGRKPSFFPLTGERSQGAG